MLDIESILKTAKSVFRIFMISLGGKYLFRSVD